ncbi:MAG: CHC2 zinc finger domain-containing protein [bacterium]
MNVFEAVKQSVTTRQAADMYGVKIRRGGMACCIFHEDRTPSMKVDNRFHCFGCGADGDVIDFVAQLYGLGSKQAAEKIAADYGISYDSKSHSPPKPAKRKQSPEQQFKEQENRCFRVLCDYLHLLEKWKIEYEPKPEDIEWHPLFVEALQEMSYTEYLVDILLYGDVSERAFLIIDQGKKVLKLEERIRTITAGNGTGIETDISGNGTAQNRERSA